MDNYQKIIIGAGLYGLYSALYCGEKGETVLVIEKEDEPFKRATYINQARVHLGYHYPRSLSTATKSMKYFDMFNKKYDFCIKKDFQQIYATSSNYSWTSAKEFEKFCHYSNSPCVKLDENIYFKENMCDGAFLTNEYTYDAHILRDYFVKQLSKLKNVKIRYNAKITKIEKEEKAYLITLSDATQYATGFLLNTTYASVNEILHLLNYEPMKIKYELCEIILCKVNDNLKNIGFTIMDGPFFSIMPFGKTGLHSLTSVTFTPHITSYDALPTFNCQKQSDGKCSPECLGNCNDCPARPPSAWPYMNNLAKKYLNENYKFEYAGSLYSMKPILKSTEIDDSRPTVIKQYSSNPTFISVLSGKINTVFDLNEVLDD